MTSIMQIVTLPLMGLTQGAQPIIGYNYGAKKIHRSILAVKITTGVIIAISIASLVFLELFPTVFVQLFTNEQSLLEITNHNIRIYILGLPFIGIHSITTTYFQSIRKPRTSSVLYILKYGAVLIPLLYIILPTVVIIIPWSISLPFSSYSAILT